MRAARDRHRVNPVRRHRADYIRFYNENFIYKEVFMNVQERYAAAKEEYAKIGVDTDAAIAKLKTIPVSLHCWQGTT